jgi:hypothetical protein
MTRELCHSPGSKHDATSLESASELDFHSFFRNSQPRRRVALREQLQFAENHDITAPGGQRVDHFNEQLHLFLPAEDVGWGRCIIRDRDLIDISHELDRRSPDSAQPVQREAVGDVEEKAFRRTNRIRGPLPPDAKIGLLGNILDVAQGGEGTAEISFQRDIVRMNFVHKPARFLGASRLTR